MVEYWSLQTFDVKSTKDWKQVRLKQITRSILLEDIFLKQKRDLFSLLEQIKQRTKYRNWKQDEFNNREYVIFY